MIEIIARLQAFETTGVVTYVRGILPEAFTPRRCSSRPDPGAKPRKAPLRQAREPSRQGLKMEPRGHKVSDAAP